LINGGMPPPPLRPPPPATADYLLPTKKHKAYNNLGCREENEKSKEDLRLIIRAENAGCANIENIKKYFLMKTKY